MVMWLPTPVYERVPAFYVLAGLLLITDGLYLGFEMPIAFYYVGFGLASFTWGVAIRIKRISYRRSPPAEEAAAPDVDASTAVEESAAPAEQSVADATHEHSLQH